MLLRPRAVLAALLVAVVVCALAPTGTAQTEEEVRDAISKVVGLKSENDRARKNLQNWGNDALPILRQLGLPPTGRYGSYLAIAITQIHTKEAVDLLVTLAETCDPVALVVDDLRKFARSRATRRWLDTPQARRIIFAAAQSAPERVATLWQAAEIIALMKWTDGVPLIEKMLSHSNLRLRRIAASALLTLTGEAPEINEPETRFPREELDDSLVEFLGPIPQSVARSRGVGFITTAEGKNLLIAPGTRHGAVMLNGSGTVVGLCDTVKGAADFLVLPTPDGETQLLAVFNQYTIDLIAYDLDGHERWRFAKEGVSIGSMAPLYRDGAIRGVVVGVGGEWGVVVLDLDGERLWSASKHMVDAVSTHPQLPDHVVICGGYVNLYSSDGTPRAVSGLETPLTANSLIQSTLPGTGFEGLFCKSAVLFPDRNGDVALVVSGSDDDSVSKIARLDEMGQTIWDATVRHDVRRMCLIEPPGEGRLIAAASKAGELFVFDEDGTLRYRTRFAEPSQGLFVNSMLAELIPVFGMKSGQLGNATVFTISLGNETLVYKVSPSGTASEGIAWPTAAGTTTNAQHTTTTHSRGTRNMLSLLPERIRRGKARPLPARGTAYLDPTEAWGASLRNGQIDQP